jgi:hypothetical protein
MDILGIFLTLCAAMAIAGLILTLWIGGPDNTLPNEHDARYKSRKRETWQERDTADAMQAHEEQVEDELGN